MAFWCRIRQSRLQYLSNRFNSCYLQVSGVSSVNSTAWESIFRVLEKPDFVIHRRNSDFCNNARFYAAPVQIQPKQEEKVTKGPRLNGKITAEFVRLVEDDGDRHSVVSRREALERAKKLKLDLVEVQGTANPPVCKIMDYHKEKYKKQLKEKDRAKSKVTVRTGVCKEVRFNIKTEKKDLQIKADMVKRLMERGYRVKCMAIGTEEQDLEGLLSRISPLIEDVALIESGPLVEKKQAYVIVRHIKFGPSKKGSKKKAPKVAAGAVTTDATAPTPSINSVQFEEPNTDESDPETKENFSDVEEDKTVWSVSNASDEFENDISDNEDVDSGKATSPRDINFLDSIRPKPVLDSKKANVVRTPQPEPPIGIDNRYRRSEPRSRFSDVNIPHGAAEPLRSEPRFQSQHRPQQPDFDPDLRRVDPGPTGLRSDPRFQSQQRPQQPDFNPDLRRVDPGPTGPRSDPRFQLRPQQPDFNLGLKRVEPGPTGPGSFEPQFQNRFGNDPSRTNLRPPLKEAVEQGHSRPVAPPSYGVFSAPKVGASGKLGVSGEVPTKNEGISFQATRNGRPGVAADLNSPKFQSDGSQTSSSSKGGGQGGWGIFSSDNSNVIPNRESGSGVKVER